MHALLTADPDTISAGTGRLRFSLCGPNTILERSFATSPLKVMTTRGVSPTCWAYTATLGGGLVGGDTIAMSVDATADTRVVLSTQASTKVYRSSRRASQMLDARVGNGALLAILPDPIVCFADADFLQEQTCELAGSANLVFVDWVTSGRHANGERWAFRRYASRLDVRRDGRRVAFDTVRLSQEDGSIADRLAHFEVTLTAIVTGPALTTHAVEMVRAVSALAISKRADLVTAAWPLRDGGALLRIAGVSVEQVGTALRDRLSFLTGLLGDNPWLRKW